MLTFVIYMHFIAQFHDAIRTIFPDIIRSLRGNKQEIWSGTLVVEKLAALSMWPYITCVLLQLKSVSSSVP
jgi:hypothetical protein